MKILSAALSVLLGVCAPSVAEDVKAGAAPIQSGPTLTNTNSSMNPNLNVGGANVNTINTQTGLADPGAAGATMTSPEAQAGGPQAGVIGPNAGIEGPQNTISPTSAQGGLINPAPGAQTVPDRSRLNRGGGEKNSAQQQHKTTPQSLNKAMEGITKSETSPAGAPATGDAAAELSHVFDAAHKYDAKVAGPEGGAEAAAGAIGGSAQAVKDKVVQNVRIANEPSTHPADVPGLYLAGLDVARQALAAGTLSKDMAALVAQKIFAYASAKAKTSLPELANGAYQAAASGASGEREVERAVGPKPIDASDIGAKPGKPSAFDQWQELLGQPGKPLISNLERLKKDVWRAQGEAAKAGAAASGVAVKISFEEQVGSYFAVLPNSSVSRLPELTAQLFLGPSPEASSVSDLAQYERDPSLTNAFRAARGRAGLAAALGVWVRTAAMNLWQWVWDRFLTLTGRGPVQALGKLARAPSAAEASLAGTARVSFADFSSINGPYLSAQELLSRPGALTVGRANKALAQAATLAAASSAVTASRAGARAVELLRARVARETSGLDDGEELPAAAADLLLPGEGGDLSSWLERLRSSAMNRLDEGALDNLSKQAGPALVYADLSGDHSMVRVYLKSSNGLETAAGLSKLGYRIQSAGGAAVAVYDWESGSDGFAAVNGALELLASKKSESDTAPAADMAEIDKAVAAYLGHKSKDRLADFEAVDPSLSRFAPADIVEKGPQGFWVERSRGRLDGRLQDLVLLRDLKTRRPVFGQAFPIPALH